MNKGKGESNARSLVFLRNNMRRKCKVEGFMSLNASNFKELLLLLCESAAEREKRKKEA